MFVRILFFALLISQPSQATFLLCDKEEFGPVEENYYYHPQLTVAHLLPKAELESGICSAFSSKHIQAIQIPQTCWDLFAILNLYRERFPLPGARAVSTNWACSSNGLINFIRSDASRLEHFRNKRFGEISRSLVQELNQHLKSYHLNVKKISGNIDDPIEVDSSEDTPMWLYADTLFPQMEQILVQATVIEQECYELDEIPLWRHSRTSIIGSTEETPKTIIDIPLYIRMDLLEEEHQEGNIALGTMSYGFSLLANMVNDGRLGMICDYGPMSACTFSYFIQHLRDKVYVDQGLPFYVPGQTIRSRNEAAIKIRDDSILSVVRMPKAMFKAHYERGSIRRNVSETYNWFIPLTHSVTWIYARGEASHPRHRGTALKEVELEGNSHTFYGIPKEKAITCDQELFALATKMVQQTNHMRILAVGNAIVANATDTLFVELLANRNTFVEEVLKSPRATEILKSMLKKTYNGIDFF